jgi:hypothetical protein
MLRSFFVIIIGCVLSVSATAAQQPADMGEAIGDGIDQRVDTRFDENVEKRIDQRFNEMVDKRVGEVAKRITTVEKKLDERTVQAQPAPQPQPPARVAAVPPAKADPSQELQQLGEPGQRLLALKKECEGTDVHPFRGETAEAALELAESISPTMYQDYLADCKVARAARQNNTVERGNPYQTETAPPVQTARQAGYAPTTQGSGRPVRRNNGVTCPALGSKRFYELNGPAPRPNCKMVEQVPGKDCGGWFCPRGPSAGY